MTEEIDLRKIKEGTPGILSSLGAYMYDACMAILHRCEHQDGVSMHLEGNRMIDISLRWADEYNDQMDRTFREDSSMIDYAASCISCLLAIQETSYTVIERGYTNSGIDYFLGYENDPLFSRAARLEISGIYHETLTNKPEIRLKAKIKQTRQSDNLDLPAYVSIIEFSKPRAIFKKTESL
jgi:hypothetical protein